MAGQKYVALRLSPETINTLTHKGNALTDALRECIDKIGAGHGPKNPRPKRTESKTVRVDEDRLAAALAELPEGVTLADAIEEMALRRR